MEDGLQASKLLLLGISQIIIRFSCDPRLLTGVLNLLGFWIVGYQTIPLRNLFINVGHLINNLARADVLKEKFKRLKQRMKTWNKEKYGDTFTKFKKIELELNKLEEDTIHTQLSSQEETKRKQLQEVL